MRLIAGMLLVHRADGCLISSVWCVAGWLKSEIFNDDIGLRVKVYVSNYLLLVMRA